MVFNSTDGVCFVKRRQGSNPHGELSSASFQNEMGNTALCLNEEPRRHFSLKAAGAGEFKIDSEEA